MPNTDRDPHSGTDWSGLTVTPVLPEDPAKIGDFWLDGRLHWRPSGTAYLAHGDGLRHLTRETVAGDDQAAVLIQLHAGAAADKAARDRFSGMINGLHIDDVLARGGHEQDQGRLGRRFRSEDDDPVDPDDSHPIAPWAALALTTDPQNQQRISDLAEEILAEVDLIDLQQLGRPTGPDYRLPWLDRFAPGHNRVWPLPWPGRFTRAGAASIAASWLLMMALAAIAVLIAILLFRNSAPQSPPPQTGRSSSPQSPQSGSGSPGTPPPTPSGSPSNGSASPNPSESGSPSPGPSGPTTSGTASPGGTPTPPSRL